MGQIPGGAEGLGGQVALVTGGGRGIGRAISQGLAAAGASVAIVARSTDQIAETADRIIGAGGRAIACPADVSDGRAVERMFEDVERAFGPVRGRRRGSGQVGERDRPTPASPVRFSCCRGSINALWYRIILDSSTIAGFGS
jgi:NAD(P)-dependent dehydrogenase (short-subunit alcohol dehydrogenase family)